METKKEKEKNLIGNFITKTHTDGRIIISNTDNGHSSCWCHAYRQVDDMFVLNNYNEKKKLWNPKNGKTTEWILFQEYDCTKDAIWLSSITYKSLDKETMTLSTEDYI